MTKMFIITKFDCISFQIVASAVSSFSYFCRALIFSKSLSFFTISKGIQRCENDEKVKF